MIKERRENLVNIYLEFKTLITKLIDIKENRKKTILRV